MEYNRRKRNQPAKPPPPPPFVCIHHIYIFMVQIFSKAQSMLCIWFLLSLGELLSVRTLPSIKHSHLLHTAGEPPWSSQQTCKSHCRSNQKKQRRCCQPELSIRNLWQKLGTRTLSYTFCLYNNYSYHHTMHDKQACQPNTQHTHTHASALINIDKAVARNTNPQARIGLWL